MTLNGDGKDINVLSRMTPQEEAIKWFEEEAQRLPDDSSNKSLLKVAIEALQFKSSVVRCKECKSRWPEYDGSNIYMCTKGLGWPLEDGYCHEGKRRDEE